MRIITSIRAMVDMCQQQNHRRTDISTLQTGVRGYYAGGPKTTLSGFRVEIVGTNGYILISDKGATLHQDDAVETIEAPSWDMTGIPAGVRELVGLVAEGGQPVSPGSEGYKVVQIIIGFLTSQQRDNGKVQLPLSGG